LYHIGATNAGRKRIQKGGIILPVRVRRNARNPSATALSFGLLRIPSGDTNGFDAIPAFDFAWLS
jgi:hypothetical protein